MELEELVTKLTASNRTTDPAQWRSDLESVLDVDQYLKYLAANQVISNWDTYGKMTHNYYLYTNPADGKINWIPWDNNESLTTTGPQSPLDFDFGNLSNTNPSGSNHTWPMIYNLYQDATYKSMYDSYVDQFIGTLDVSYVSAKVTTAHSLIEQ